MTTQIWQHITSGDRYAVEVDSYNQVVGATGPLHYSDIPAVLAGDWDLDPDVTQDIREDADNYRDVTSRSANETE